MPGGEVDPVGLLAAQVVAHGGHYLDTPVNRTPKDALAGRLNVLAGGDAEVLDKVRAARRLVDTGHLRLLVEIDGGINADTIEAAAEAGVDCFVAGSAVFGAADPGVAVAALRSQAAAASHHLTS